MDPPPRDVHGLLLWNLKFETRLIYLQIQDLWHHIMPNQLKSQSLWLISFFIQLMIHCCMNKGHGTYYCQWDVNVEKVVIGFLLLFKHKSYNCRLHCQITGYSFWCCFLGALFTVYKCVNTCLQHCREVWVASQTSVYFQMTTTRTSLCLSSMPPWYCPSERPLRKWQIPASWEPRQPYHVLNWEMMPWYRYEHLIFNKP